MKLHSNQAADENSPCAVFLSATEADDNAAVREKLFNRIGGALRLHWFELPPDELASDPARAAESITAALAGIPGKISVISHGRAATACHALVAKAGFPIHRVAFISPVVGADDPDYATYLEVPVLIVQGTQDTVAPWGENGRRLLEGSADVTVEFVPNAGHRPHLESERATWQAVIGFLRDEYPVFVSDDEAGTQVIEIQTGKR